MRLWRWWLAFCSFVDSYSKTIQRIAQLEADNNFLHERADAHAATLVSLATELNEIRNSKPDQPEEKPRPVRVARNFREFASAAVVARHKKETT